LFISGDDVADLVASELGLQNKRKVMLDFLLFLGMCCFYRSLIIIIYLLIHMYPDDPNEQQMILRIYLQNMKK
jgi:maltodextrin utilization protein YvdJ